MANTPILITGCQRSGTTLLSLVLDSHPRIHSVDEADFDPRRQGEYLESPEFHPSVAFKLPSRAHRVEAFAALPGARILWCRRDPRAVVASMLTLNLDAAGLLLPWARHPVGAQREIENGLAVLQRHHHPLPEACLRRYLPLRDMPPQLRGWGEGVVLAATCWRIKSELQALFESLELPFLTVSYERLTRHKEAVIRDTLDFLALPWHENVLRHHQLHRGVSTGLTENTRAIDERSLEKWRRVLSEGDLKIIEEICGSEGLSHGAPPAQS